MADNLLKRPAKGILKTSSSFEQQESQKLQQDLKWDEMNILQTLHPPDKDYGHMKVEEPKTPYSYYNDDVDGAISDNEGHSSLDADLLSKKISMEKEMAPKALIEEDMEDSEEDENETEEDRAKRKVFEYKRKLHYNEFYAIKLARKLMQQDIDEDVDEEKVGNSSKDDEDSQGIPQPNLDAKDESDTTQPKSPQRGFAAKDVAD